MNSCLLEGNDEILSGAGNTGYSRARVEGVSMRAGWVPEVPGLAQSGICELATGR